MTEKGKAQSHPNKLTPNQKLLLRLQQHPNRVVKLLLVLDGKGQVQIAQVEDVGKVERFG